jgi:steroid delta-isomerase-like uncharacterized protein
MKSVCTGIYLLTVILLTPGIGNTQSTNNNNQRTKNKEVNMSTAQNNKEVVRKIYDQALNTRNMNLLKELVSDDYVGLRGEKGAAAFEAPVAPLIKAFPDVQWKVEELMAVDDKVVVRWTLRGTHTSSFQHFTATGKSVSNDGMAIFELKNGKVTKGQVHTDRLGFLQSIEALPSDLALLPIRKTHKDHLRFIDKFLVPAAAKQEFMERVVISRNLLRTLPGFVEDAMFERTDENGNLIFISIAVWENEDAIKNAKEVVQSEYKKQGFNPSEMFERLHITLDRGVYKEIL